MAENNLYIFLTVYDCAAGLKVSQEMRCSKRVEVRNDGGRTSINNLRENDRVRNMSRAMREPTASGLESTFLD